MTEAVFSCKDGRLALVCNKHSEFAIVCSGVSALVSALASYAYDTLGAQVALEPGKAEIVCYDGIDSRLAFEVIWRGLKQIEMAYPRHLRVVGEV